MIVRTARDLGSAVRDARLRRGWTQAELADRIGASRQWVVSFERGKATAEVGTALRAIAALGAVLDVVPTPNTDGLIDLDELLDDQP
jgi:transcriptional regulator with XRE-family HTH domain